MRPEPSLQRLTHFLIAAKQQTYAAGGSGSAAVVPPLIPGSHQLEYRQGDFLYRDIYFGEAHFAGQEVVCFRGTPIWSMCYAGGWTNSLEGPEEAIRLAGILQAALRLVPSEMPYRGPSHYLETPYAYHNEARGALHRFEGGETIQRDGVVLYQLFYTGGSLD